jgi:hypothetical protein
MSDISKALDQSQQLAAERRRNGRRVPGLLLLHKTSKRRPLLLLFTVFAPPLILGSIWLPSKIFVDSQPVAAAAQTVPVPAQTHFEPSPILSAQPKSVAKPTRALAQALDKLIVKAVIAGPSPRILTEKGSCSVGQELSPSLYLVNIEDTTLVARDGNGAVYRKKF